MFPKIFAHRGASAYAPENTLIPMEIAKKKNALAIECDVLLTADNYPVIFHDVLVDRTTNGKGAIAEMTLSQIQKLDGGSWFSDEFTHEPIPTLDALLQKCVALGLWINLEIKPTPGYEKLTVEKVLESVARYWPNEAVPPLFSSFCEKTLILLREQQPEIPIGMLYETWDEIDFYKAEQLRSVSIHLEKSAFTKARVERLHREGYVACAYTVNDVTEAKALQAMGVSSCFSDYPDLLATIE